jgi:transposase-like protein
MQANLSEEQITVINLLKQGASISEAARKSGCTRMSIYRWKKQAAFKAALEAKGALVAEKVTIGNKEITTATTTATVDSNSTKSLVDAAMQALQNVLLFGDSDTAKVSAAKYILDRWAKEEEETAQSNVIDLKSWLSK